MDFFGGNSCVKPAYFTSRGCQERSTESQKTLGSLLTLSLLISSKVKKAQSAEICDSVCVCVCVCKIV